MKPIEDINDPAVSQLCEALREMTARTATGARWPKEQLQLCADAGVHAWFLPQSVGGVGFSGADVVRAYLALSEACLDTTFVLTQRVGACRRIAASANTAASARLLPALLSGETFATLGISHLSTSRRHLGRPSLVARPAPGGFVLDGMSPWVTGAVEADHIVTGADLAGGEQILVALPTSLPGVRAAPPGALLALNASRTGAVHCDAVWIGTDDLLAGPSHGLMSGALGARTGGLQTSSLALGLAGAALGLIRTEAHRRPELRPALEALSHERATIVAELLAIADAPGADAAQAIRVHANDVVTRSTQAALVATKGRGYVSDALAGIYCRQALFFLVWSSPGPVQLASLNALAGLGSAGITPGGGRDNQ
jgi:alkylation response protein AidB-like acyl-CoA dehydrogenase